MMHTTCSLIMCGTRSLTQKSNHDTQLCHKKLTNCRVAQPVASPVPKSRQATNLYSSCHDDRAPSYVTALCRELLILSSSGRDNCSSWCRICCADFFDSLQNAQSLAQYQVVRAWVGPNHLKCKMGLQNTLQHEVWVEWCELFASAQAKISAGGSCDFGEKLRHALFRNKTA